MRRSSTRRYSMNASTKSLGLSFKPMFSSSSSAICRPILRRPSISTISLLDTTSNPVARWHICQGSINSIAFSTDGTYIAIVGRDGYLRVFDYKNEQLICGGKSYYGVVLCCAWSMDGKYVLIGGEDDLVQVWSMEDHKVVAWGEGHNSWVSGVAFDSYWSSPNSNGSEENVMYRFGSVGQDPVIGDSLLLTYTTGYVAPLLLAASFAGALQSLLSFRKFSAWINPMSDAFLLGGGIYTLLDRLFPVTMA